MVCSSLKASTVTSSELIVAKVLICIIVLGGGHKIQLVAGALNAVYISLSSQCAPVSGSYKLTCKALGLSPAHEAQSHEGNRDFEMQLGPVLPSSWAEPREKKHL